MLEMKEIVDVIFREFINLFFVPLISVYIYCIRNQIKLVFSGANFIRYGIMLVMNVLISDILVKIVQTFHELDFSREGVKYGFVASVVAVTLPYAIEIIKKCIKVDLEIESKNA